jgi:hypothetical protein
VFESHRAYLFLMVGEVAVARSVARGFQDDLTGGGRVSSINCTRISRAAQYFDHPVFVG